MQKQNLWIFTEQNKDDERFLEVIRNPQNAVIILTENGEGKIVQEFETTSLIKNSIVFIEPSRFQSIEQTTHDLVIKIVVYKKTYLGDVNIKLNKLKIFKYFSLYFKEFADFSEEEMTLLFEQIKTMGLLQNFKEDIGFNDKVLELLFSAFIYTITGIYLSNDFFEKRKMLRADEITFQFTKNVFKYCTREKSPQFYADLQNITSRHLSSMIKSVTGKTASQVITEFVMNEAKILLKSTDKTVMQIADDLNFGDSYTFSHYFKRNEGESPVLYRTNKI